MTYRSDAGSTAMALKSQPATVGGVNVDPRWRDRRLPPNGLIVNEDASVPDYNAVTS